VLERIDENFPRREGWIFRKFSLGEFFYFKGQDIRNFQSVAGLKVFPVLPRVEFLNVSLCRMKPLGYELQQRRVRKPFQFGLLGVAARHIANLFQVFFFDCVGRVSHWNLIKHPLIDRAGLRHRVRVLV
jgi:hypothetical protein